MNYIKYISARLSLRAPQHESLKILADVLENIELSKTPDLQASLKAIQDLYPSVQDFERDFPSLSFTLATGVGKTRLMGAFISYLYLTGDSRNCLVLAPNLTIYEKLKREFRSPSDPKYVFKGITEFVSNPPMIITGEDYDVGNGARLFAKGNILRISIFNISKINATENKQGATKSKTPRVKRLRETIGESYFDYLASQLDLVMLMDEAHHYRATAGAAAINELKPILGIELTATPKRVGAKSVDFKNIIYGYSLAQALKDGYVKNIAIATQENFRLEDYNRKELDYVKLEGGALYHENVRAELKVYAEGQGKKIIKPFMLVVAQNTKHAGELRAFIESEDFRDGAYKGKVAEVHSKQSGVEEDENIQKLISIEDPNEPTEIVIHVNKLKEGWDVANLYTIVPLRASASEILTEQTMGRGLRLPYGEKTGVRAVDLLTIVAHDRFQEIVDRANQPNSIINKENIEITKIGEGAPFENPQTIDVPSVAKIQFGGSSVTGMATIVEKVLDTPLEQKVAEATLKVIEQQKDLKSTQELLLPETQMEIAKAVSEMVEPESGISNALVKAIVKKVAEKLPELIIEIPNFIPRSSRESTYGFKDFNLEGLEKLKYQPVNERMLSKELGTNKQFFLYRDIKRDHEEDRDLKNYIILGLKNHDEIDYDGHAELLHKLAGQVVEHFRSYLGDGSEVGRVLIYYHKEIVAFIFEQLEEHTWETPSDGRQHDFRGFVSLKPFHYVIERGVTPQNFREIPKVKRDVKKIVFGGFKKCCYPLQKFDSVEGELRFAQILEEANSVVCWMKPTPRSFQIEYDDGIYYEPDFVVKTAKAKYLCEPKMKKEMESGIVIAKRNAAVRWCQVATQHATKNGGAPWHYALIPHTAITLSRNFDDLMNEFVVSIESIE